MTNSPEDGDMKWFKRVLFGGGAALLLAVVSMMVRA